VHFLGSWNGTGTCDGHHGEADCYADALNLAAVNVTNDASGRAWDFTACLFASQRFLCADTWEDASPDDDYYSSGHCGASAYDAASFAPVIDNCTAVAGFSDDEV